MLKTSTHFSLLMPDKVRWGILSTARINRRLIPAIKESPRSVLVGVASRSSERAAEYAAEWDITGSYGSYEDLLADPSIDVVYIPLPNDMHTEWTVKSLEAGKHVLCEKPMCLSMEELEQIRATSERTGKSVSEGFMYLHHPQTSFIKSIADSGRIGELRALRSTFSFNWNRGADNYRLSDTEGGGSLWDIGVYPVSFFQYLTGEEPTDCKGYSWPGTVDMRFVGALQFPGGVMGEFYTSFDSAYSTETLVHGTEATLRVTHPYNYMEKCRVTIEADGGVEEIEVPQASLYLLEVEDMNSVVLDGSQPHVTLDDSARILRTVLRLRQSAGLI